MTTATFTAIALRPLILMVYLPAVWLIARTIMRLVPPGRLRDILNFEVW